MALKLRQVAFADMTILNKVDMAGPDQVQKVRAWIDSQFGRLRVVETTQCNVPSEILLSVGRFDPAQSSVVGHILGHGECDVEGCDHAQTFSTWSFETRLPLSLSALREAARKLPGNIFRSKGIVYASDAPERRAVLQVVGRRVDISLQEEWRQREPCTKIVVIGAARSIDASLLNETFAACISKNAEPLGQRH
jgi:G3E family GTPase